MLQIGEEDRMRERLYVLQGRVFSSMGDIEKFQAADTERTEGAISRLFEIIEGVQGFEKEFVGTPMGFCAVVEKFLAFAYGHRVDLEHAVWAKYPNQCPYCGKTPCMCYGRPHGRYRPKNLRMPFQNGLSLGEMQRMFARVYPRKENLALEVAQVHDEFFELRQEKDDQTREFADECADVLARFCRLATSLGISLEGLAP